MYFRVFFQRRLGENDMKSYPTNYYEKITGICNRLNSRDLDPQTEEQCLKDLEVLLDERMKVLQSKGLTGPEL